VLRSNRDRVLPPAVEPGRDLPSDGTVRRDDPEFRVKTEDAHVIQEVGLDELRDIFGQHHPDVSPEERRMRARRGSAACRVGAQGGQGQ
jgi:hypothetical protein